MRISDWSSAVCSSDLLLGTASRPAARTLLYAISALLLLLVVFAQLYLGVQWFSTALLLLLFGLAWTALLGLGYRWHQPEKLPVAQVLPLIALSFFIALALQWYPLGGSSVKVPTAEYSLSPAQWKTAHGTHRLPTQRPDSGSEARRVGKA